MIITKFISPFLKGYNRTRHESWHGLKRRKECIMDLWYMILVGAILRFYGTKIWCALGPINTLPFYSTVGNIFFIGLLLIMGLFGKHPAPLKTAPALALLVKRLLWWSWNCFEKYLAK